MVLEINLLKQYYLILLLRGKISNSFEISQNQLFNNAEIHNITLALRVKPHSIHEKWDISKIRHGKIIILSDADGDRIQVLLLTLFYTHFPYIINSVILILISHLY